MKKINGRHLALIFLVVVQTGCSKLGNIDQINGTSAPATIVMSGQKIPENKIETVQQAGTQAIDAIYSPQFENELASWMRINLQHGGDHLEAWRGLSSSGIASDMKESIKGLSISTYGGPVAVFKFWCFGNLAFDGSTNGPILLNRWALRERDVASVANSIAHETAHRVGLSHPSYSSSHKVGEMEPPYVIGEIVERIVEKRPPSNSK
jgi:hypothetical protein